MCGKGKEGKRGEVLLLHLLALRSLFPNILYIYDEFDFSISFFLFFFFSLFDQHSI